VSYTSWFLDAFNYAMFKKINVLNLSIGGPDFMDHPFVDKVSELAANKIITVSAIGNDGPLYGTLNNPGDQSDVVGVGGINSDELVAKFSSRGMTTWELPNGYGRIKPDIVTYGSHVKGSSLNGGCISLSGTSVASPVVAGAVALILSGAPKKLSLINQALVKQILAEGAVKLQHNNIFEQGHGKLNISKSLELLLSYEPKITLSPPYIDYSESYMWPYSSQPLHCVGMPSIVNVTIWNAISVTGRITSKPEWQPNLDKNGDLLLVEILYSQILWPWTGWMAVKISVTNRGCYYEGNAEGSIKLVVYSSTQNNHHRHTVQFPIKVKIAPKPPRHKRILWDQYHNIQYPPGYIPRDSLKIKSDPLDWRGDHIHTNFRDLYHHLRNRGYYIDVLGAPYTCFNASEYGSLLIIDPEEEFFDEEIYKLQKDVFDYGLGVVIFADWYNTTVMKKMQFFDENTREWWIPDTGGANIPALNDLLHGFGISLSDIVADGYIQLGEHSFYYGSGTTLDTFPQDDDTILISALLNDQGAEVIRKKTDFKEAPNTLPIIGLFQMNSRHRIKIDIPEEFPTLNVDVGIELNGTENDIFTYNPAINKRVLLQSTIQRGQQETNSSKDEIIKDYVGVQTLRKEGRVAIMGDSNCIDSINAENACMWLINAFLEYTMNSHTASVFKKYNSVIQQSRIAKIKTHPKRLKTSKLHKYSKVVDVNNKLRKRSLTKCTV
uniref:Uncharacterized protein n=2 Tax=Stomoxys calcitrans TaxID=35570 RepID=A0A1I8PQQ8_STOCA